jgi:hypothetical protein
MTVPAGRALSCSIGHRYGNVPESMSLNPDGLSLTELEFREARRLGRPMLLFVMGPDHEVKVSAVKCLRRGSTSWIRPSRQVDGKTRRNFGEASIRWAGTGVETYIALATPN